MIVKHAVGVGGQAYDDAQHRWIGSGGAGCSKRSGRPQIEAIASSPTNSEATSGGIAPARSGVGCCYDEWPSR
jgi:hypothetical protein